MIHRHRNATNTARSGTLKNIVFQKKTGRWYVTAKIYADGIAEAVAIRSKLLLFINSLVDTSCTALESGIPLIDDCGVPDAHAAASESGGNNDK